MFVGFIVSLLVIFACAEESNNLRGDFSISATTTCSTPSGTGTCISPSSCTGTSYSGYCTGGSDVACCVPSTSPSRSPSTATLKPTTSKAPTSISKAPSSTSKVPTSPVASEKPVSTNPVLTRGLDFYSAISSGQANCIKSLGNYFIVTRGMKYGATVDSNVCSNLNAAKKAKISYRDVYLYPSPADSDCDGDCQINTLLSYLKTNCASAWSGRIWLAIESDTYWTGSYDGNKAYYQSLVDACKSYGATCGVYSSEAYWTTLFGSTSYSYGSDLPLWYSDAGTSPGYTSFDSFGGWSDPYARQFVLDAMICGIHANINYSPSFKG